jgi:predicted metal-binding membrane protein
MVQLNRRATVVTVAILLFLATLAWALVARQATDMSGMVMGLGQVGTKMPNPTSAPLFLGMWVAMMVAMMFPTVAPMVLAHRLVVQRRGEGALPTLAFVTGYLLVWSIIGLVPLAVFLAFRHLMPEDQTPRWLTLLSATVLVVAGAYQFTPLKSICLRACRNPLAFVLSHDFRAGLPGALRAGVSHGAFCLGCCWALMSVLVVMGLMNLVWMAALAVLFIAEKNWRFGVQLSRLAGTALVVLGILIAADPALLPIAAR